MPGATTNIKLIKTSENKAEEYAAYHIQDRYP